jgi:class 3 adenylate cyclase
LGRVSPETGGRIAILLERVDAAIDRKEWDEAFNQVSQILAFDPDHAEAQGLLAHIERRRKRTELRVEAERRTVTVVFCDLVGSSRMAELLDPEETQEVLSWYHRIVGEAVTAAGGLIARFMGDGVLVYFGYPDATDEAPRQAIHSALSIIHQTKERRSDIKDTYGVEIDVRIGIHTGLAVITEMGGGNRREVADIVGETPNIAARLEGLADPGTVLISDDTYGLVTGYFKTLARGPQQLKNISRAIPTFQVIEATGATSRAEASGVASRMPLVGRSAEHRRLEAIRDEVVGGKGKIVVISGEAGVGKSRLVELAMTQMTAGWPVLSASCAPHTQSTPFHPLRGILTSGGRVTLHAALGVRAGDYGSTAAEREALLNAAVSRVLDFAGETPALLVLEDIHWSDPSTLEFLTRLAKRVAEKSLLVIVTLRPEIRPDWFALASVEEIFVQPLERDLVIEMIRNLLNLASPPPRFADWLVDRSGGVPLFVEELIRTLSESGRLTQALSGSFDLDADIPLTLQGVLIGRLDRLGPAKRVAQVASVIGREFDVGLLKRVIGLDDARQRRDLDDLISAGLVLPSQQADQLKFKHALIRDAAYGSILRTTRRSIHAAIANALPQHYSEILERSPEAVAIHLFEAQRFEESADLFAKAALSAATRSAHSEAINHVSMALKATETLSDGEARRKKELRLRLLLGPSLIAARGYGSEEVGDNYRRAWSLCAAEADSAELFDAVQGLTAYFLVTEQIEEAYRLAATALGIARRRSDDDEFLEASAWLGTIQFFQGRATEAASTLDSAVQKYEAIGPVRRRVVPSLDPGVLAMSHRCWLHWLNGEVIAARAMAEEMLALVETLDHPITRAHAINYVTGLAVFLGDYGRANAMAREEIELARAAKLPHYEAYGMIFLGRTLLQDNSQAAIENVLSGLALRKSTGALLALPLHQGLLAEVQLAMGATNAASLAVSAGLGVAEHSGERWWLPELYRLRAIIDHRAGRPAIESALRYAHRAALDSGVAMLATRTALSAAEILPALEPNDPLHLRYHKLLIDGDTPETNELRRRLG